MEFELEDNPLRVSSNMQWEIRVEGPLNLQALCRIIQIFVCQKLHLDLIIKGNHSTYYRLESG